MLPNQSKISSARTALLMAPNGLRYMPRATRCPCSEHLIPALPCFSCPRDILGKVSCLWDGCCSPIPQLAVVKQAAAEAQKMEKCGQ